MVLKHLSCLSHRGCWSIFSILCSRVAKAIRARRPISEEEEERRECHLEQLYRLLPPRDRGAKNYRNLLASVGLGGQLDVSSRGRQTGQQLRGQSVSDGIGKLGPNITFQARVGHRVASNSEGGGWTGGRGHIGDRASQLGGPVDWLEGPVDFLIIFCTIQFSRRWMKR